MNQFLTNQDVYTKIGARRVVGDKTERGKR